MAESSFRRFYRVTEFLALVGGLRANIHMIRLAIGALDLSAQVAAVEIIGNDDVLLVEWTTLPTDEDLELVDDLVPVVVGGTTTSEPFIFQSFAVSQSTSNTHVAKIDETTPPLDAGTYQVSWSCSLRMASVVANTGVEGKIRLERSDGQAVEQDDAWDRANRHAYNGSQPFQIVAGQTIRALLTFARLGASNTAEMSGARVTIDKIN